DLTSRCPHPPSNTSEVGVRSPTGGAASAGSAGLALGPLRRAAGSVGRGEHLAGGGAGRVGDLLAAEHPRELLEALVGREPPHRAPGAAVDDLLAHVEVRVAEGRDLREVRDAEDLA